MNLKSEQLVELQRGNMYYIETMRNEAAAYLENRAAGEITAKEFGADVLGLFVKYQAPGVTLSTLVSRCDELNNRLVEEDETGDTRRLFHMLEDLNFYVGEIALTYNKALKIYTLLGVDDQAKQLNIAAAELLGYEVE